MHIQCFESNLMHMFQLIELYFRNTRLGPAPPPPVNNGVPAQQKRTARPNNRQQIIEWWQEVELPKSSGFEDEVALPWFHGK